MARQEASSGIRAGDAISVVRRKRGLSARALSLTAGLSESYVGKVEHGEVELSLRSFAKLATTLDLSSQEICLIVRAAGTDVAVTPALYDETQQVRAQ